MKIDHGEENINSFFGGIFSLLLLILVILYCIQKADVLISKKDVDILSTINDGAFSPDDIFDYSKGFAFAAAFTAYDSETENILFPEYGSLVYTHYSWGADENGEVFEKVNYLE